MVALPVAWEILGYRCICCWLLYYICCFSYLKRSYRTKSKDFTFIKYFKKESASYKKMDDRFQWTWCILTLVKIMYFSIIPLYHMFISRLLYIFLLKFNSDHHTFFPSNLWVFLPHLYLSTLPPDMSLVLYYSDYFTKIQSLPCNFEFSFIIFIVILPSKGLTSLAGYVIYLPCCSILWSIWCNMCHLIFSWSNSTLYILPISAWIYIEATTANQL